MALESPFTGKYIDDLVATNPEATDVKSQGDDHIRGIKLVLQNTFPNMSGVVSTTDVELDILNGVTATTAELNILDGVTSTAAELNILDGVTSTAAELNILDGVTSTTAELNILDGVTSTAAELNYCDLTPGQVANNKAMVPTAGALDCNSIAFTEVNIDTGNIAAAVTGATAATTTDNTQIATNAFVQQEITAKDRFAYHQITSSSDTTIATDPATPTTIGSASISIPTKGRITILPEQVRIVTTTNSCKPAIGLQIGSTEYYVKWVDNGVPKRGPLFALMGTSQTDDYYGTWGDDDRTVESASFSIESLGITTGSQTVNLVVYDQTANTGSVLEGTTLTTKFTLIVEDFT